MRRFSWIQEGDAALRPDYDIPVLETEHFVVMPSVGGLVPGWLLLIPRRTMPNTSNLTLAERADLQDVKRRVASMLRVLDRPVFFFEHGGPYGSVLNCGVEQAHIHAVPLPFNLYSASLEKSEVEWKSVSPDGFSASAVLYEYLYVESQVDRCAAIGTPLQPQSQWFRKLIASELRVDDWDYKADTTYTSIHETIRLLSPAI